jgi:hypothetical protein
VSTQLPLHHINGSDQARIVNKSRGKEELVANNGQKKD